MVEGVASIVQYQESYKIYIFSTYPLNFHYRRTKYHIVSLRSTYYGKREMVLFKVRSSVIVPRTPCLDMGHRLTLPRYSSGLT